MLSLLKCSSHLLEHAACNLRTQSSHHCHCIVESLPSPAAGPAALPADTCDHVCASRFAMLGLPMTGCSCLTAQAPALAFCPCQSFVCTGGQEEAQRAYEEAYNDVFNLQLDCHRHAQPHKSRRGGTVKWDMIEMWPMQVNILPQ